MTETTHGVGKIGIMDEPLEQILDSLEVASQNEHETAYSNPLGVDCPCCDRTFHRAVHSTSAWSTIGAPKPLEICVGDTSSGRILFAHLLETDDWFDRVLRPPE